MYTVNTSAPVNENATRFSFRWNDLYDVSVSGSRIFVFGVGRNVLHRTRRPLYVRVRYRFRRNKREIRWVSRQRFRPRVSDKTMDRLDTLNETSAQPGGGDPKNSLSAVNCENGRPRSLASSRNVPCPLIHSIPEPIVIRIWAHFRILVYRKNHRPPSNTPFPSAVPYPGTIIRR